MIDIANMWNIFTCRYWFLRFYRIIWSNIYWWQFCMLYNFSYHVYLDALCLSHIWYDYVSIIPVRVWVKVWIDSKFFQIYCNHSKWWLFMVWCIVVCKQGSRHVMLAMFSVASIAISGFKASVALVVLDEQSKTGI